MVDKRGGCCVGHEIDWTLQKLIGGSKKSIKNIISFL